MNSFQIGDRVRRINYPSVLSNSKMPLNSIWTVSRIDGHYLGFRESQDISAIWYKDNFELVEDEEMYYLIETNEAHAEQIANALKVAGIKGKVSAGISNKNNAPLVGMAYEVKDLEPQLAVVEL